MWCVAMVSGHGGAVESQGRAEEEAGGGQGERESWEEGGRWDCLLTNVTSTVPLCTAPA